MWAAAVTRVVREGFIEEVVFWQKRNDGKEPALERGGWEREGPEHSGPKVAESPEYSRNRHQPRGWSLGMENVLETIVGLGRPGRPGEEFGFQGHCLGTEHYCLLHVMTMGPPCGPASRGRRRRQRTSVLQGHLCTSCRVSTSLILSDPMKGTIPSYGWGN